MLVVCGEVQPRGIAILVVARQLMYVVVLVNVVVAAIALAAGIWALVPWPGRAKTAPRLRLHYIALHASLATYVGLMLVLLILIVPLFLRVFRLS
jgi:hypothetical protein